MSAVATGPGPMAAAGTNGTPGAGRIAAAFRAATEDGRAALIPYLVAGYPDAETSFRIALAAADAGADLLEVGLPYSDPLADGATLQRASRVALEAGATFDRSIALIERIAAARPRLPLVPMAYANQVIGGGDGGATAARLVGAGASGIIVADLTPDEGGPFEAVAREAGLAVVYLVAPTTSPERRARIARAFGRVPVLRLAGRRHRGARHAPALGGPARPRRTGGQPGPGRGRLRGQPAGPRPGARRGRRRRRHRRLGARRCPRPGRPRRRRPRPCRLRPSGGHPARLSGSPAGPGRDRPISPRRAPGRAAPARRSPG